MDSNESQAIEVVMTMTATNGDKPHLVAYADGGCGLLRNGVSIPEMKWVPCKMDQCTAELLRLGKASAWNRAERAEGRPLSRLEQIVQRGVVAGAPLIE